MNDPFWILRMLGRVDIVVGTMAASYGLWAVAWPGIAWGWWFVGIGVVLGVIGAFALWTGFWLRNHLEDRLRETDWVWERMER